DQSFVNNASSYVGYMYMTNNILPNPWSSILDYFDTLVTDLENELPKTISTPPSGLKATGSSSQINLYWTAPTNNGGSPITGYKIERSEDGGTTWSASVSNTGTNATKYANTGLAPSTTFDYRVSAINGIGTSDPSNSASAKTLAKLTL